GIIPGRVPATASSILVLISIWWTAMTAIASDLNATNIRQHAVSRLRPPHLRSIDGEVGPGRDWPCLHRRAKLLASSHARGKKTHFGVPRISLPVPGVHRSKNRKALGGTRSAHLSSGRKRHETQARSVASRLVGDDRAGGRAARSAKPQTPRRPCCKPPTR